MTAERTRHDPGVESVLVDGTKRRKTLLCEASLLSAAVFLEANLVAGKHAMVDVPPLPFTAMWFISHDSGGNE